MSVASIRTTLGTLITDLDTVSSALSGIIVKDVVTRIALTDALDMAITIDERNTAILREQNAILTMENAALSQAIFDLSNGIITLTTANADLAPFE